MQALAALALLGALQRRHALRLPERGDLARLKDFAGPVGTVCLPVLTWLT